MTIQLSWTLNADEAADLQRFMDAENAERVKAGNEPDTIESYVARVGLKTVRGHIERTKAERDEANQKAVVSAVVEKLKDETSRAVVLEVIGLRDQDGKLTRGGK